MPPPFLVTLRITILAHGDAGGRGIQPISGNQQPYTLNGLQNALYYVVALLSGAPPSSVPPSLIVSGQAVHISAVEPTCLKDSGGRRSAPSARSRPEELRFDCGGLESLKCHGAVHPPVDGSDTRLSGIGEGFAATVWPAGHQARERFSAVADAFEVVTTIDGHLDSRIPKLGRHLNTLSIDINK